MKNYIIILLMITFFAKTYASQSAKTENPEVYSEQLAEKDIKSGNVKFLLRGGIVSTYKKGQEVFEKKYNIKYSDFGCVMPANISIEHYNNIVSIYLDQKFGKDWRKEVRMDVVGF